MADRVVLITGAASGIGAASAARLAAEGARLVLADVDTAAEALAEQLEQVAVRADVTRSVDIERMLDVTYERWGRLDALFNNAGVIQGTPLLDLSPADWDRMLDVNLRAVFFVLQAAARRMIDQAPMPGSALRGKLIQTASTAAYRGGLPIATHYAASKAGVVSITRSAAQALAARGITSNCICPGSVATPLWTRLDADWTALEGWEHGEAWTRRIASIPLGRAATPADVAGVVAFLVSSDSDYMTGQAINVDGGAVMGN